MKLIAEKKIITRSPQTNVISLVLRCLDHLYNSILTNNNAAAAPHIQEILPLSTSWKIFPKKHCQQHYQAFTCTRTDVTSHLIFIVTEEWKELGNFCYEKLRTV